MGAVCQARTARQAKVAKNIFFWDNDFSNLSGIHPKTP
jgi:hypothetical protein